MDSVSEDVEKYDVGSQQKLTLDANGDSERMRYVYISSERKACKYIVGKSLCSISMTFVKRKVKMEHP